MKTLTEKRIPLRGMAAMVSAGALALGTLGLAPAQAAISPSDTAGSIAQWGRTTAGVIESSYPAEDGPWSAARATNTSSLLAIRDDGSLDLLVGGGSTVAIPADVAGEQVRSADVYGTNNAGAVLSDGSVRIWGAPRGIAGQISELTPDDLDPNGPAVEAEEIAVGTTLALIRLADGRVGMVSTFGYEIVVDFDSGEELTDAVQLAIEGVAGYVLRGDGAVLHVSTSGVTVVAPADPDPIVMFDRWMGVRSSGEVVTFDSGGDSVRPDSSAPDIEGDVIQVAAASSLERAVLTDRGEVVAWGSHPAFEVPEELQGRIVALTGSGNGIFTAIVGDPVEEPPFEVAPDSGSQISGTAQVGQTLSGIPAEFTSLPDSSTTEFRYYDDGDLGDVLATDQPTYVPVAGDIGEQIVFVTTGVKDGVEVVSVSDPTEAVIEAAGPQPIVWESSPTVEGDLVVGETLIGTPGVVTGTIDPEFGVVNRWIDGMVGPSVAIADGNEPLTLTEEHIGMRVQLVSIVRNPQNNREMINGSGDRGPVVMPDFASVSDSAVSGTAKVGETLTGTPAEFNLDPDEVTYVWLADGEMIQGATGTSLVLAEEHEGAQIVFRTIGDHETADEPVVSDSDAIGPVLRADIPVQIDAQAGLSGTPEVGQTLTGTPAEFSGDIVGEPVHEWLADGEVIGTGTELVLTTDHIGAQIQFRSTVTELASGDDVISLSEPLGPVVDQFLETAPSRIEGTAEVGQALAGIPAQFRGEPELAFAWLADGELIEGADGLELVLTEAHEGAEIQFRTIATRDGVELESTSEVTAPVAPEDEGGTPPDEREGGIDAPGTVRPGDTITVQVGEGAEYAGEEVSVWMFSEPRDLGLHTVAADGSIRVTIPADVALGEHQLAVYLAGGPLIGSQVITVVAADAAPGDGGGAGAGPGSGAGGSSAGGGVGRLLPRTGADLGGYVLPAGLVLLTLGAGLVAATRRRMG